VEGRKIRKRGERGKKEGDEEEKKGKGLGGGPERIMEGGRVLKGGGWKISGGGAGVGEMGRVWIRKEGRRVMGERKTGRGEVRRKKS